MKPILLASFLFFLLSGKLSAQGFSGDYALPGNWIETYSPDNGNSSNEGSVDLTTPNEVLLSGSTDPEEDFIPDGTETTVDFTIVATTSGIWSFKWVYHTNDGLPQPEFDPAQVIVNGVVVATLTVPSTSGGSIDQSGTYTSALSVNAGDAIGFRVSSVDNQGGNATLRVFDFVAPGGVLPVTLNFFNAKQSGEQVKLDWTTQTESNSDRFEVERSTNGKDFKVIATVKAAGNTTLTQQYAAIDNNPENGNNYYRLRQVDLDGKYVYSMIKTLKWTSLQLVKVYPNPVHNKVILRFTPDRNETTSITLFDGSGRTLQQRNLAGTAGSNMVTEWNVEGLAPGIYFFRINNNLNSPLRFVKQ